VTVSAESVRGDTVLVPGPCLSVRGIAAGRAELRNRAARSFITGRKWTRAARAAEVVADDNVSSGSPL
jgi:hypothetical protein